VCTSSQSEGGDYRGETQEARESFDKAVNLMEHNPGPARQDRLEGQLLRREVEQVLERSEPAKEDMVSKVEE
jgi:hypothetical protein